MEDSIDWKKNVEDGQTIYDAYVLLTEAIYKAGEAWRSKFAQVLHYAIESELTIEKAYIDLFDIEPMTETTRQAGYSYPLFDEACNPGITHAIQQDHPEMIKCVLLAQIQGMVKEKQPNSPSGEIKKTWKAPIDPFAPILPNDANHKIHGTRLKIFFSFTIDAPEQDRIVRKDNNAS